MSVGADDSVGGRQLPGDQIVSHPTMPITRAITIQAPPHAVWPWLDQMGYSRAGWYIDVVAENSIGRSTVEELVEARRK
jgi:hypothetical protein